MDIIVSMLVAVHVIVCLLLVVIVLMQRPKQEGLGAAFGGGVTDQMFGAQTTDVLQKATVWLSVMFFVITMVLAILISKQHGGGSSLRESLGTSAVPAEVEDSGGLPVLPKGEESLTAAKVAGEANPADGEAKAKAAGGEAKAEAKPAGDPAKAKAKASDAGAAAEKPKGAPAGDGKGAGKGSPN